MGVLLAGMDNLLRLSYRHGGNGLAGMSEVFVGLSGGTVLGYP